MDIVSSFCKPRIVCRWPFAVEIVDAAAANAVVANANFIVNVYVTGRLVDDNGDVCMMFTLGMICFLCLKLDRSREACVIVCTKRAVA